MKNLLLHIDMNEEVRLGMALANAENFPPGGGKETRIVIVANGSAVTLFQREKATAWADRITDLAARGVSFRICRNALASHDIAPERLLPVYELVPAGIVELVRLQSEGYAYVKP